MYLIIKNYFPYYRVILIGLFLRLFINSYSKINLFVAAYL